MVVTLLAACGFSAGALAETAPPGPTIETTVEAVGSHGESRTATRTIVTRATGKPVTTAAPMTTVAHERRALATETRSSDDNRVNRQLGEAPPTRRGPPTLY